jgi:hypothetical protein
LVKGVEAVSIHGGKDQEERNEAIKLYKDGIKDVLVATDIAAKGLDFPDIQHVINFDMPKEIENYVHRIGRTGRCGKTGVATTFINKDVEESILLDLKHLLIEAKQRVPPVLQALDDPDEDLADVGGTKGCSFCGGMRDASRVERRIRWRVTTDMAVTGRCVAITKGGNNRMVMISFPSFSARLRSVRYGMELSRLGYSIRVNFRWILHLTNKHSSVIFLIPFCGWHVVAIRQLHYTLQLHTPTQYGPHNDRT